MPKSLAIARATGVDKALRRGFSVTGDCSVVPSLLAGKKAFREATSIVPTTVSAFSSGSGSNPLFASA
ncbi:hypothetical protein SDC9_176557 [bioreactor metagenome]|uniref:Uncharacterized protein n=1 Tax=bioreactor metagenome TaxID=1076179 RepID=A0A645GSB6_9ZZZZ